jgi:hypothetical protein
MNKCECCGLDAEHRIKVPSNTALWMCYDCFSYWVEGYTLEQLLYKIKLNWRDKTYK